MSYFTAKLILGSLLFLCGLCAAVAMLTVMGKTEKKMNAATLRRIHRAAGAVFLLLLLILAVMGSSFWSKAGDGLATRAVLHAVLAATLFIILIFKIAIARFYKQLLRMVPSLGVAVFCLSFVVFFISGGYYSLRLLLHTDEPPDRAQPAGTETRGRIDSGQKIFAGKCASCHRTDSEEKTIGPGLENILIKDSLPHSGRPATVANILAQLERPVLTMPSFTDLTEQELADLIAYLKTL